MGGGEPPGEVPPGGELPGGEIPGGELPGEVPPGGELPGGEIPGGVPPAEVLFLECPPPDVGPAGASGAPAEAERLLPRAEAVWEDAPEEKGSVNWSSLSAMSNQRGEPARSTARGGRGTAVEAGLEQSAGKLRCTSEYLEAVDHPLCLHATGYNRRAYLWHNAVGLSTGAARRDPGAALERRATQAHWSRVARASAWYVFDDVCGVTNSGASARGGRHSRCLSRGLSSCLSRGLSSLSDET